jgi:amino acid transporter
MPKSLERDLGLLSVVAISIGAMVGSGIFILPALAVGIAGPAVIVAYLLAGVLVVPAALSKAEMATAMPEAGGTYIYIERGMGPLLGTIAGIGTWFSLAFKGGLALVGGIPYLLLLVAVPDAWVLPLTLGLAALLVLVNLLGSKTTGRLQVVIVAVMLAVMAWFVLGGVPSVNAAGYSEFFGQGAGGIVAATGLVFVSYAGVTKVASVAEEVEDPDRNIPLGILGSLAFTTLLYALVVTVMVGVADLSTIGDTKTPMADVAEVTLGTVGVVAVVAAALLALVSTANAGILSSSRYPFAMARDGLVPRSLGAISEKFGTPSAAILLTGGVLFALIAFVPVMEIAKLASAFQILVFSLVNLAVVAFREGHADYDPTFESPLYPWMQYGGAIFGLALITQMGTIPLVGAVVITVGSVLWYLGYARNRVEREGAAVAELRQRLGDQAVTEARERLSQAGYEVLVGVSEHTSPERERTLVRTAVDVARAHDGGVAVVRFDVEPDQTPLSYAETVQSPGDEAFESFTRELAEDAPVPVSFGEIVSHDTSHAVTNVTDEHDADLLLLPAGDPGFEGGVLGGGVGWIRRHAACDVASLTEGALQDVHEVRVVTDRGPYDPVKLALADAIASVNDATVTLEHRAGGRASTSGATEAYHADLAEAVRAPVRVVSARTDGGRDGGPDVVVVSANTDVPTEWSAPRLAIYPHDRASGRLQRWVGRRLF